MHGRDWSGEDCTGWWMSEKLNGWRCVWTGVDFFTRQCNRYDAPEWFELGMPSTPLDGELWAGPGTTDDDVKSAVLRGDWSRLSFRPFDVPVRGTSIEKAQEILAGLNFPAHVKPVSFRRVASRDDAFGTCRDIIANGGEGIMLRAPRSKYDMARVFTLLKLKRA